MAHCLKVIFVVVGIFLVDQTPSSLNQYVRVINSKAQPLSRYELTLKLYSRIIITFIYEVSFDLYVPAVFGLVQKYAIENPILCGHDLLERCLNEADQFAIASVIFIKNIELQIDRLVEVVVDREMLNPLGI